ncbi:MAG: TRZ/ATZ family protein [Ruminococcaceae bacterium]|nr:TRZ/ATZ family protein [Oscillospiraceae bacterium]
MKEYKINTKDLKDFCEVLKVGDKVYLSGTVFTARDAAHKRIFEYLESNRPLPFEIENSVIYYAGPTPTPQNLPIGSCGPTTSKRMDFYTPKLLDLGLLATIGKGERNADVTKAIIRNRSVYLCAIGGAGALAAKCIKNCEVIAFDDLGCESIKKLELEDFPLIVGIDSLGNSIYKK